MFIEYVSLVVGIVTFVLGLYLGRRDKDEQLKQIIKASNLDRILDGRTEQKQELFVEDGKVRGTMTISNTAVGSIVDWNRKKIITPNSELDMTPEEIEKYRPKKTPI
jgi:hypothetical protein